MPVSKQPAYVIKEVEGDSPQVVREIQQIWMRLTQAVKVAEEAGIRVIINECRVVLHSTTKVTLEEKPPKPVPPPPLSRWSIKGVDLEDEDEDEPGVDEEEDEGEDDVLIDDDFDDEDDDEDDEPPPKKSGGRR